MNMFNRTPSFNFSRRRTNNTDNNILPVALVDTRTENEFSNATFATTFTAATAATAHSSSTSGVREHIRVMLEGDHPATDNHALDSLPLLLNKYTHTFHDRELEAAFLHFFAHINSIKVRYLFSFILTIAVVMLIAAWLRDTSTEEMITLHVTVLVLAVCTVGLLVLRKKPNVWRDDFFAFVGGGTCFVLTPVGSYYQWKNDRNLCDLDQKCIEDAAMSHGLNVGMWYTVMALITTVAIGRFSIFVVGLLVLDFSYLVLFRIISPLGHSSDSFIVLMFFISVSLGLLNRAVDKFLRKDFLWFRKLKKVSKQHLEKMEKAREHKQRVVGYLFHEVRNPINNIVLAAELLEPLVRSPSPPPPPSKPKASSTTTTISTPATASEKTPTNKTEPTTNDEKFPPSPAPSTAKLTTDENHPPTTSADFTNTNGASKTNNNNNKHKNKSKKNTSSEHEAGTTEISVLVKDILTSAAAASHVLDDALSLEKLEAGTFAFARKSFVVPSVVVPIANMFARQAVGKQVKIVVESDNALDKLYVLGDLMRLQQVLRNFISNALKFTESGGEIRIRTKLIEHTLETVTVRVSVSDNGIGINPDDLAKLFVPFSQIRPGEQQAGGGTGLGLSLSKDFVERGHNGKIGAISPGDDGHGSTFFFVIQFPVSDEMPESQTLAPPPSIAASSPAPSTASRLPTNNDTATPMSNPSSLTAIPALTPTATTTATTRTLTATISTARDSEGMYDSEGLTQRTPLQRDDSNEKVVVDVLIVEDSGTTRKLLGRLLDSMGKSHEECENGLEALTELLTSDKKYRIVLMDKEMPIMDGFETVRILRRNRYRGTIVGITGNALKTQMTEFLEHGVDHVVAKPINKQVLTGIFEQFCPVTCLS